MKMPSFPHKVTKQGVSVTIGRVEKDGQNFFRVLFREQGKRKQAWRSTFEAAKRAADDAIEATLTGDASALKLNASDRHAYLRAMEFIAPLNIALDHAAREYAEIRIMLAGKATPAEVCRDWLKRNAVALPCITVADAVEQLKSQSLADGKSKSRRLQLTTTLGAFAIAFNCEVSSITPSLISGYLSEMQSKERTRRNHRDIIGFFNRWLVMRGFLVKGTDWLEGVQNYTARKLGEITNYTADEMRRLIAAADARILPMIVIGGFAGLRHAEIARLDWSDIYLDEGFIEVKAQNAKTDTRRIVPIKDNLKQFLLPQAKESGKVITVANTFKLLAEAIEVSKIKPKQNALRHTYISARVAESGDVARVADEAGNSPQVIRSNYLKRIRPAAAAEWFSIKPQAKGAS